MTSLWRWLRACGLWPMWRIVVHFHDYSRGDIYLHVAGPFYPARFEGYHTGLAFDAFDDAMRPLRPCSTEWRHRIQLLTTGEMRPQFESRSWDELRRLEA